MSSFGTKLGRIVNEYVTNVVDSVTKSINNDSNVVISGSSNVVQTSIGSSNITIQNDVKLETSKEEIRLTFKKPRKVYVNGKLV